MRSLLSDCSIRNASNASRTLRRIDTSLLSSMFLATCWVIVEAPIGRRPEPYCMMSNTAARAMAIGSTPL